MLMQMIIINEDTFVHNICLALTTGSLAVLTTTIITFNYSSIFKENDIPRKEGKISN